MNWNGYLTTPSPADPLDIAKQYMTSHAEELGLLAADVSNIAVTDRYTDSDSGITHIYLGQLYKGLEVSNANFVVNVMPDGRLINVAGGFVTGLNEVASQSLAIAGAPQSILSAQAALASIATPLGLTASIQEGTSALSAQNMAYTADQGDRATILVDQSLSLDPISAKLNYVPTATGGVVLAWNFILRTPDGEHWYDASADASTGSLVEAFDWVDQATYNVFASPTESPEDGSRTIVTDPNDTIASPYGWHDTNGVTGAEYTDTRGNNVSAQEDTDANNTGGFRPDGGTSLNFDFSLDLTQAPSAYQSAAITNLFYWNNLTHDIHYTYGFTEVAGNFQVMNYSGQGLGNDAVQADAQDGRGTNNANFATPPDGSAPRMQMYRFTYTTLNRDGDLDTQIIVHEYGHGVSNRLVGGPSNVNALNAIQSGGMGEGWSDWWGLMFTQKASDTKMGRYPVGTYVLGQSSTGAGIRRYPYSFDMTIDPLTYGDIKTHPEVHDEGEVWCAALWDMSWLLIDKYGFSSDIEAGYDPAHPYGNTLALKLVMDSLKLMPTNPSFLQGRDAILLADRNLTGGANQGAIWAAFARRGMGYSAYDGGSGNSTNVTQAFDVPSMIVSAQTPAGVITTTASSVDFAFTKDIQQSSFAIAADVVSFTSPTGSSLLSQITGYSFPSANTLRLTFTPQATQGLYTVVIGPNILAADGTGAMDQNLNGTAGEIPGDCYTGTFRYDSLTLQVASTTPANGGVITVTSSTTPFQMTFNEAYAPTSIGANDLTLSQGSVTSVQFIDATTVQYNLSGVSAEQALTVTMAAGAVTDVYGNVGAAYSGTYQVDIISTGLSTPAAKTPLGSQVYEGTTTGVVNTASDTDSFTIALDAGQRLTAYVVPASGLQGVVSITGPDGSTLGTVTATAAGKQAVIQSVPVSTAGTYTITIASANGTSGSYTLQVELNAAVEDESHNGTTNDTLDTAQNLDPAMIVAGAGQQAAVVGTLPTAAGNPVATETFDAGPPLGLSWSTYSSLATGRIQVTGAQGTASGAYALTMDNNDSTGSAYNLNEAIWTVNLTGVAQPSLTFYYADWSDDRTGFSGDFTGHYSADGIAISTDGVTWHPIWNIVNQSAGVWQQYTIDLGAAAVTHGITLDANCKIKFQQYDNYGISTDGIGFDQIAITTPTSIEDWYRFGLTAGQSATLGLVTQTSGTATLSLYDSGKHLLAKGVSATSLNQAIANFVASTTDTYYVQVSGTNVNYNLVVTKGTGFDIEANDSLSAAQEVSGTGGVLGYLSGTSDAGDYYRFSVKAGDALTLSTLTPADGSNQFANTLDPKIELYNSSGTLVASNENGAADGRNALLNYTAAVGGSYVVRVLSAANSGEYALSIQGATGNLPAFSVASTTPVNGATLATAPTTITVVFNDSILQSSVQNADLLIDGVPNSTTTAPAFADSKTVVFTLLSGLGSGTHTVSIAAGSIFDLQNTSLSTYTGTFVVDTLSPHIIASSVMENDVLSGGSLTYTVTFDEDMSTSVLDSADFSLIGTISGTRTATSSSWTDARHLQLQYTGLLEDNYTLTLFSAAGRFQDAVGNLLDGESHAPFSLPSGDGVAGGDFVVHFSLDTTTAAFPTLTAKNPLGSLVYEGVTTGMVNTASDTDSFTIALDAGQLLTAFLTPTSGLQAVLTITGPDGSTLGIVTATATDKQAVLQTVPVITAGTYTITVASAGGTSGSYTLQTDLNAAVENELHGGANNDTIATAQNIDGSFLALSGNAQQGTVIGALGEGNFTISASNRVDIVPDSLRNLLYITTTAGDVLRYDLSSQTFLAPFHLGGSLRGADISPDQNTLVVADGAYSSTNNWIDVVDLTTGNSRRITFTLSSLESGTYSVAFADDNTVLVSATFNGSGWVPLRKVDLTTEVVTTIMSIQQDSMLSASADHSVIAYEESNTSSGAFGRYSVSGGNIVVGPGTDRSNFEIAASRDGQQYAVPTYAGTFIYNQNLQQIGLVGTYASMWPIGVAYSPVADRVYFAWAAQNSSDHDMIDVYDTNTLTQIGTIDDGPALANPGNAALVRGRLKVSQDGSVLFATVTGGVNVYDLTPSVPEDWYRLSLTAGQSATIGLTASTSDTTTLSLYDSGHHLLATGIPATNLNQAIANFVASTTDTYYVQVSGTNANYNLVVTKGASFDIEANDSLSAAQEVSGTGGVLGYLSGTSDAGDYYRFSVKAGDALTLSTLTPADGSNQFANILDAKIELYNPSDTLVASNDNGAADGRNALLNYTAAVGGNYVVRVLSAANSGEYALSIQGATGNLPPFSVASTTPVNGATLATAPATITVVFNDSILQSSVENADLLIDGVPNTATTALTFTDSKTVVFTLPAISDGTHTISIAAGSIFDLQNTSLSAYTGTFVVDTLSPHIIASSVIENDVLTTGSLTYTVTFDEDMATTVLDSTDFDLVGTISGTRAASSSSWTDARHLQLQYTGLSEDNYTLTLFSAAGRFQDAVGNLLDGESHIPFSLPSGDGVAGGDFVVHFSADNTTTALPTLTAKTPLGSLVYEGTITGMVNAAGDTDSFTIALDAGQRLTAYIVPGSGLQGMLSITGPDGSTLGTVTATAAGKQAVIQSVPVSTAGTYTITIASTNGTSGNYTLQAELNAAVEDELHDGASNDTLATAQDIDGSFIDLTNPASGAVRGAVLGQTDASATSDNYSFSVIGGDKATLGITGLSAGNLNLELLDGSGAVIATATGGSTNFTKIINGFSLSTSGTCYARVTGDSNVPYTLVVVRNAALDTESNDTLATAQNISGTHTVLGNLSATGGPTITLDAIYTGWWKDTGAHTSSNKNYIAGIGSSGDESRDFFVFDLTSTTQAFSGAELKLTNPSNGFSSPDPTETYTLFDVSTPISTLEATGSGQTAVFDDLGTGASFAAQTVSTADNGRVISISLNSSGVNYLNAARAGQVALGGAITTISGTSAQRIFGYTTGSEVNQLVLTSSEFGDYYLINVAAPGSALAFSTSTPADGPRQFANLLDAKLELYDPSGTLVATDDNGASDGRNALLNYTATVSGNYVIRVLAAANSGEYVLSATQSSSTYPIVTSITPSTTGPTHATSLTYTVAFNQQVFNVTADDFQLTGTGTATGAVTAVSASSGTTFTVTVETIAGDGTLRLDLKSGTDVQNGAGNQAPGYSSGAAATVDHTAPAVTSITPATTGPTNATSLTTTIVFSEAVVNVTPDDFQLTNTGTATGTITSISGSGATYTVTIGSISGDGTLRLDLKSGTNVQDAAGNETPGHTSGSITVFDHTPPTVTTMTPSISGGTVVAGSQSLSIDFSEAVVGGGAASNYQLRAAGADGLLGTADDPIIAISVSYSGTMATLTFQPLTEDVYRLTAHDTITDVVGNKLDGDGDGIAGGDWRRDFVVVASIPDASDFHLTNVGGGYAKGKAAAIQSDGKIVVAGYAYAGSNEDFVLARYNANGSLDTSFGIGGKVTTSLSDGNDSATAMVIQSDGKIVVVGIVDSGDFGVVRYSSDGTLDTTFGSGGMVITAIGTSFDYAESVAIQSDGKIVVAGTVCGSTWNVAVVRYNSDGTLDTTFGGTGEVTTTIGTSNSRASAVAIQSDGKIVAVGYASVNYSDSFALARYNTDGSLDTTFGTSGTVTTDVSAGFDDAYSVAIRSDGKIVVAGSADGDFGLVRYNNDGSVDTTFGTSGRVTTDIGANGDCAYAIALQSNGEILSAGSAYVNGSGFSFALVRYQADGSLDTTFGSGGKVSTVIGISADGHAMALQSDGKIVVAGTASASYGGQFALARYTTNGTLDTAFGTDGKVATSCGYSYDDARSIAIQSDGKVVSVGSVNYAGGFRFLVARYSADGTLDASFGTDGIVTTSFSTKNAYAYAVAIQADGKIVVAGCEDDGSLNYHFAMARYNTDGSLDTTFNGSGKVVTGLGSIRNFAYSMAIQSDGKIVAVGTVRNGSTWDFGAVRYNTNGTLDTTFGGTGSVVTPVGTGDDCAYAVAIQGSGKIVVAGYATGSTADFALVRYNTDGSLDTTFGGTGKVVTAVGTGSDCACGLAIQSDDKILAAGYAYKNSNYDFAVIRYNTNGTPDASFGNSGIVTTAIGSGNDYGRSITLQADNKIVVAGYAGDGTSDDVAIARYNTDGSLDTTFDGDGKLTASIGSENDRAYAVALRSDGTILLAGQSYSATNSDILLMPLTSAPSCITLSSTSGLPFDIGTGNFGSGQIIQGSNNSFDGDGRLMVGGQYYHPGAVGSTLADSGRTVVTNTGTVGGLTVSRKVTVPSTGSEDFARTIDRFVNNTGSTITTTVTIVGNLGSDGKTTVFGTSSGDTTITASDQWIGTDDNLDGTGAPAIIHYIHGPKGLQPASASIVGDNIIWTYDITVAAGETVELAYFTIVANTRAAAEAAANTLVTPTGFGGQAAAYLTPSDLDALANFSFLAATDLSFTPGTITGTYGGTTTLVATLTAAGQGLANETVAFSLNGSTVGTATTDANGVATLTGVSLAGINAGNYTAYVGASFAGDSDYVGSVANTELTVNKTALEASVTVNGKVYDGTTTASIASRSLSGIVGSDDVTLTGGTAAFADKNVGATKTVTVTGLTLSGTGAANYTVSDAASVTANITQATLTVSADSLSRLYRTDNPTLTCTYSGFVGGETLATSDVTGSPSLATTATADSPIGTYAITVSAGTLASQNYKFDLVNGTLTVDMPAVAATPFELTEGTVHAGTQIFSIGFNTVVVGAETASNYELRSAGADGLLDTADDSIIAVSASYSGTTATLSFSSLPEEVYRLTIRDTITDIAGNKLDGDGDGTCGGVWMQDFVVLQSGGVTVGTPSLTGMGVGNADARDIAIQADGKIVVAGYAFSGGSYDFLLTRYNADGSLDAGFGTDGKVMTAVSGTDYAYAVAIQADGKIVAAGYANHDLALVRYNSDGSLDTTFGTGGKVITPIGTGNDYAYDLAIQSNGKIVAVGCAIVNSNNDFAVVRYNSDGSLDTTFGGTGKVTTDIGTASDCAYGVAILSNGKIVVAGYASLSSNNDFALVCYNADGSLNTAFGTGGIVTTAVTTGADDAKAIAIQSNGKIVVAGGAKGVIGLVRYNANGSLDATFGSTGKVVTSITLGTDYPCGLAVQSDDKILTAGYTYTNSSYDVAVARYNTDGTPDISFDGDGKLSTAVGTAYDYGRRMALQSDGKIVVAGVACAASGNQVALIRYNANGSLDTTFDTDGIVTTACGYSYDDSQGVAIQSDGKVVAVGSIDSGNGRTFLLARYNTDGSLDSNFGTGGTVITTSPYEASSLYAYSVAIQADGKIVVGGYAYGRTSFNFVVARYNIDGSLDATFDGNGVVTTDIEGYNDYAYSLAIQSDGKIVVAGWSQIDTQEHFVLVRYNTDGSLDTTFDGDGKVATYMGTYHASLYAIAIQTDGKIVVAGDSDPNVHDNIVVLRYNADGSLDTAFGGTGIVTTNIADTSGYAHALAIQPDGKIVVAGYAYPYHSSSYAFALVRYNTDGSLDTSFDSDGMVTTSIETGNDRGRGIALQPDGRIIVVGYSGNGTNDNIALARYNIDGSLDTTFDGDGTLTISLGSGNDRVYAVALQSDGSLFLAGQSYSGTNSDFLMMPLTLTLSFVNLSSASGMQFHIDTLQQGAGQLVSGTEGVFDGMGRLLVGGSVYQPASASYTMADDGRSVVTGTGTAAGLTVSRKVTVPNAGSEDFARTVDTFTNNTGSSITTTVTIVGNLGSDGNTTVFATSDGDTIVETTDLWVGTDDTDGSGTPAIVHYIHGPHGLVPTSVSVSGDNIAWSYTITVAAGQTVELAYFNIVAETREAAESAANALVTADGLTGHATDYLSSTELASLANFYSQAPFIVMAPSATPNPTTGTTAVLSVLGADVDTGESSLAYTWSVTSLPSGAATPTFSANGTNAAKTTTVSFRKAGSYTFLVTVSDGELSTTSSVTVTVSTIAPTAVISGTSSGSVGTAVTLTSTSIDPWNTDQANLTLAWNVIKRTNTGATSFASGSGINFSFTPNEAGLYEVRLTATDLDGLSSTAIHLVTVDSTVPTTIDANAPAVVLEAVLEAAVNSSGKLVTVSTANTAGLSNFLGALAEFAPASEVTVQMNLADDTAYQGMTLSVPANVTLVIDGQNGQVVIQGHSPALTVSSGQVIVQNGVILETSTDDATILVTGGSLTIRNSTIRETTGGTQAAIAITGGTVDLGAASDAGGNTFVIQGSGLLVKNTATADVSALRNTWQQETTTLTVASAIEAGITDQLDNSAYGRVNWDTAPTVTVSLDTDAPYTSDTLTATATATDVDGNLLTLTYEWRVNGTVVETVSGTSSRSDTFDLSLAGHGEAGDVITVTVTASDGTLSSPSASDTATVAETAVVGRYTFYNNSYYGTAIATDKVALLPGETASFVNVTSYRRGLNGIMIDVAGLAHAAAITADDLTFRVGNDTNPLGWNEFTLAPKSVTVGVGQGAHGSDRIVILWADYNPTKPSNPGAAHNQWLEVTVKATTNSGLSSPDVFYFGNLIGETGFVKNNFPGEADVTVSDIIKIQNQVSGDLVDITNLYDIDRSGMVVPTDIILCQNQVNQVLYYFTAPSMELAAEGEVEGMTVPSLTANELSPIVAQTVAPLTPNELSPTLIEAVARWVETGLDTRQSALVSSVQVVICDLPDAYLGAVQGTTIYLDTTAAGHGWFVDPTPDTNEEFTLMASTKEWTVTHSPAATHYDLLTVVFHELGHVLGLEDVSATTHHLMSESLPLGTRRLPQAAEVDALFGHDSLAPGLDSEKAWDPWDLSWKTKRRVARMK